MNICIYCASIHLYKKNYLSISYLYCSTSFHFMLFHTISFIYLLFFFFLILQINKIPMYTKMEKIDFKTKLIKIHWKQKRKKKISAQKQQLWFSWENILMTAHVYFYFMFGFNLLFIIVHCRCCCCCWLLQNVKMSL